MSWSVGATGKAAAVAKAIAKQFADAGKCVEPEETVRQAALSVISAAINGQGPKAAVTVNASGHQSGLPGTNEVSNTLTISVQPLYGFIE